MLCLNIYKDYIHLMWVPKTPRGACLVGTVKLGDWSTKIQKWSLKWTPSWLWNELFQDIWEQPEIAPGKTPLESSI